MSGNRFLLDTNIILYILNGDETLTDFLFEKQLYVSVISEMELLSYKNISAKEKQQIEKFLKEFVVIYINENIKNTTVSIKKNSNLKLPDSIIAATSTFLEIPLLTSDKQFRTLENLELIYYEK